MGDYQAEKEINVVKIGRPEKSHSDCRILAPKNANPSRLQKI